MCKCHSILECCVTFSGVKLSIRSFVCLGQTAHNKGIIHVGDFIAPESLWSILKHFLSTNKQIYPNSYITVVNICLWKGTFTLQLSHETWGISHYT